MDWQIVIGMSSVVIAICAIVVSIWYGVQTRKHNKLSCKPHLITWTHSENDQAYYYVEVINNGLGPALIEKFTLKVDGEVMPGERTEPIDNALKKLFHGLNYQSYRAFLGKGHAMAAQEKRKIIEIKFSRPVPKPEFVEETFNRGDIEIAYKSFYGESFLLSTEEERAMQS